MNPNTFSSKGITMPCRFLFSAFFLTLFLLCAQVVKASRGSEVLPDSIPISALGKFHIQGIAMDKEKRYLYVSYTTQLVKIDRAALVGWHGNSDFIFWRDTITTRVSSYRLSISDKTVLKHQPQ